MTVHTFGETYALNGIIAKDASSSSLSAYVALFTTTPTDTNASSAEVSGNGYSRQTVTLRRNTSANQIQNDTSTVRFTFTGTVSGIRAAAVTAGSSRGANDLIFSGAITNTDVSSGDSIEFGNDTITLSID